MESGKFLIESHIWSLSDRLLWIDLSGKLDKVYNESRIGGKLVHDVIISSTVSVYHNPLDNTAEQKKLLGVVGADLPVSKLSDVFKPHELGPNGYAFLSKIFYIATQCGHCDPKNSFSNRKWFCIDSSRTQNEIQWCFKEKLPLNTYYICWKPSWYWRVSNLIVWQNRWKTNIQEANDAKNSNCKQTRSKPSSNSNNGRRELSPYRLYWQ